MRIFRVALTFLTVFPAGIRTFQGAGELARSAVFFPLVGLILGGMTAAAVALLQEFVPLAPLLVLVLAALFFLTRGLHLDGLADTADGLIGGLNKERALEIMKDGAVGPMGAGAVLLVFLFKYTALASAPAALLLALLVLTPVSGRWSMVLAGAAFGPAKPEGLGSQFIRGLTWGRFAASSVVPLAVLLVFSWLGSASLVLPLLSGVLLALVLALFCAQQAARRLDGLTGDVLGAVNEIAESAFLLGSLLGYGLMAAFGVLV